MTTRKHIDEAIEKGVAWLKAKQNANGSYGKWCTASTGLAVRALLKSNVSYSEPTVSKAINYILNTLPSKYTYFRSLSIMALIAGGEKTPDILKRVQADVKWLLQAQGEDTENINSYGGWGCFESPDPADGVNTQYAIEALYAASLWGISIPGEVWNKAVSWYQRNYDINKDGSYLYVVGEATKFNSRAVLYTMTCAALLSLRIINSTSEEQVIKDKTHNLINEVMEWLNTNYTVRLSLDMPESWNYYYLYCLKNGCVIEPRFSLLGTHDWFTDLADYLKFRQVLDGKWVSDENKEASSVIHTSFSLLALANNTTIQTNTVNDTPGKTVMLSTKSTENKDNLVIKKCASKKIIIENELQIMKMGRHKVIISTLNGYKFDVSYDLDGSQSCTAAVESIE